MARALIITDELRSRIAGVIDYAKKNLLTFDNIADIKAKVQSPPGDLPGYVVFIPMGYRVCYSRAQLTPDTTGFHHISISVDTPGNIPAVPAACEICKQFGMNDDPIEWESVWLEEFAPNHQAINIIQYIE